MKFKAVMFDLDGTLLDTINGITGLVNYALGKMGYPKHDTETYKKIVGEGIEKLVRNALPEEKRNKATIAKCLDIVLSNYEEFYDNRTKIYPGISEVLIELKELGYKLVILSNRPDKYTQKLVKEHFPENLFDMVSGALPDLPHKPDPTAALKMINEFKIKPDEFVYLGDTDVDMQTANNAGMFAVGVLWGFRSMDELKSNGARIVIKHPEELIRFLCDK